MLTRIVKLPYHDNVLVGRDLNNLFKNGHVYEIKEVMGEIIIKDVGESSLVNKTVDDYPNPSSKLESIMCSGNIYFTEKELNNG